MSASVWKTWTFTAQPRFSVMAGWSAKMVRNTLSPEGAGYVGGLRAQLAADMNIIVTAMPVKVWLDVCWTGSLTSVWQVESTVTVATELADYVKDGVQHYVLRWPVSTPVAPSQIYAPKAHWMASRRAVIFYALLKT